MYRCICVSVSYLTTLIINGLQQVIRYHNNNNQVKITQTPTSRRIIVHTADKKI